MKPTAMVARVQASIMRQMDDEEITVPQNRMQRRKMAKTRKGHQ